MANATAFFVQFPHPGEEHNPPTGDMPWNTGDHGRKFLLAPGRYIDGRGRAHESQLVFWGEWEPPSRVERRWPASGRLPRALHRPYWRKPANSGFRQNTDPWVFGEQMLYSNCRQLGPRPRRQPNSMQRLTRGSVICFGSTIDGEFCVDTVFVVASRQPWVPRETTNLDVDKAFKTCTADSLVTDEENRRVHLTLYRGATFDDPVEGMFSFVPARRADADDPRFPRPSIFLPDLIDPSIWRGPWGSNRSLAMDRVRQAWENVRRQILDADLLLAVWLQTPGPVTNQVVIPNSSRQRC